MRRRQPTVSNSAPNPSSQQRSRPHHWKTAAAGKQQQQPQSDWLTLQFSSQAAEHGFLLTWARSIIPYDRWLFLLLLLLVPIWVFAEAGGSSCNTATAGEDGTCTPVGLPFFGLISTQRTARQADLWAVCFLAAARIAALLQLLLRPAWHVQRRTAVVFVSWLLDVTVRLLLQLLHRDRFGPLLFVNACMAVAFVMYHMPLSVALPCCSSYWIVFAVLHHATVPGAAWADYALQLLVQLLLPLGALYAVQRRARTAYLSELGAMQEQQPQQQQQHHSNSLGDGSISRSQHADGTSARNVPNPAAAAGGPVHAASSAHTAAAAAVEPAAAAGAQPADDAAAASAQPTASLVYESPLLHRTVAIKVHAAARPDQGLELTRLAATVQSAVAGLPGMTQSALGSRLCIPGCTLFLGTVTCSQHDKQQQQQRKPGQQQKQQHQQEMQADEVQQQQQPAVDRAAAWQIELGGGCSSAGAYDTVDMVMAAAKDGSLQAGVVTWLAGQGTAAAQEAAAVVACQESYVVCAWGSEVQLAMHLLVPASSGRSKGPPLLRLVLTRGSVVVSDREQALQLPRGDTAACHLTLQLPSSCEYSALNGNKPGPGADAWLGTGLDSSSLASNRVHQQAPAALSLYLLPAEAPSPRAAATSNNTLFPADVLAAGKAAAPDMPCAHLAAEQEPFAPLARVSLLLLPPAAAQELTAWLQRHRLTQQQLRPMLADLTVAVEVLSMAGVSDPARFAGTVVGPCAGNKGGGCGCGRCGVPAELWELAVAATERLSRFFAARGFCSCSDMAQQLLAALQAVQPQPANGGSSNSDRDA